MEPHEAVDLGVSALLLVVRLSAPGVVAALTVGLLIGLFQAVTQLQEQTISIVPKMLAVYAACAVFGAWMLAAMVAFARQTFSAIAQV